MKSIIFPVIFHRIEIQIFLVYSGTGHHRVHNKTAINGMTYILKILNEFLLQLH